MKILLIDSGIGGLSIFHYLKTKFPNNQYTYLMDNKNFPYGEKTDDQLLDILINEIRDLTNGYDLIIVACNTLSTIIVENNISLLSPTITMMDLHKISSVKYFAQPVNLLATRLSTKSKVWKKIYKNVELLSGNDLAKWIENREISQITAYIKTLPLDKPIILSCTHYNFIRSFIPNCIDITSNLDFFVTNGNDKYSFDYIVTKIDEEKINLIKNFK